MGVLKPFSLTQNVALFLAIFSGKPFRFLLTPPEEIATLENVSNSNKLSIKKVQISLQSVTLYIAN